MVMTPDDDNRSAVEIPFRLQPGDIWFYIELALIDDVPALYTLLATMDIKPQLAFMRTPQGIEVLLLLAHENRHSLVSPPDDYYLEAQQTLANAINTEAMHCRFRRVDNSSLIAA
jgi:hypothetical protein